MCSMQSPLYSTHPTPSPASRDPVPSPATSLIKGGVSLMPSLVTTITKIFSSYLQIFLLKTGGASPLPSLELPEMLAPLSPLGDGPGLHSAASDTDQEPAKPKSSKPRSSHKPPKPAVALSEDDSEDEPPVRVRGPHKKEKSAKRHRKSSSRSISGSGSERVKSRKVAAEESDSELETVTKRAEKTKGSHKGRSQSATPVKKPESRKKAGSAQSTPRQRTSSTTPVRDRRQPEAAAGRSPSKSSKKKTPSQHAAKVTPRNLSESEEDELPSKSPAAPAKSKNALLGSIFGARLSGSSGGKGKGKDKGGRGKGGITVVDREEPEDIYNEAAPAATKSSPIVSKHQSLKEEKSSHLSPKITGEKEKSLSSWGDPNNRENHSSWANKKDGLQDDLTLSDDDSISSPGLQRRPSFTQSFKPEAGARPSLLVSLPLSKLGRSLDRLQNKFRQKTKKAAVKQECWITSGDERGGSVSASTPGPASGSGRKRKPSESPVKEKSDLAGRGSDRTAAQHRKTAERTQNGDISESRGGKRRPEGGEAAEAEDQAAKRLRPSPTPDTLGLEASLGNYCGPGQS